MQIFCELRRLFEQYEQNEQNVCSYYMLNHRKRGLLFHYKKIVILQLASIFLVRVFRNTLILSVKVKLTMNKMFVGIICQTIEWEVDFSTAKKNCYFGFYLLVRVSKTSWFSFIRRYSPCCKRVKLGHYSVLRPRILCLLLTLYGKMT